MRGASILLFLIALSVVGWAKPVSEQSGSFSVPAPNDWKSSKDILGLNIPGSAWFASKDGLYSLCVASLPVTSKEEAKIPLDSIAGALSEQLAAKGFRGSLTSCEIAGTDARVVQSVNRSKQRLAIIVTRKGKAVALVYLISSGNTDVYTSTLNQFATGFKWLK